jgi:hypothetical protein
MAVTNQDVQKLYIAYFNRPADFFGLQFQVNAANATSLAAVANGFANSPEFLSTYAGQTDAQFVNALYVNLFGRQADLPGLSFWINLLNTGVVTKGTIALELLKGAINQDATTIANKVAAAAAFYAAIDTTPEATYYSGPAANAVAKAFLAGITDNASLAAAIAQPALDATMAQVVAAGTPAPVVTTFTLTTGTDTVVGTAGNDTFNVVLGTAAKATLNAFDSIDGGAGVVNTLNIVDTDTGFGATSLPNATIKNIQVMNVQSAETAGVNLDTTAISGLNTLNVAASVGADTIKAAATTAVTVVDSTLAAGTTSISGGSTVNATVTGVTTGGAVNIGSAATAGAITATVTDANTTAATVTGSTVTVAGGTTVNVTQNIAAATSVAGTANTATGGAVNVNGGAATSAVTVKQTAAVAAVAGNPAVAQVDTVTIGGASAGPIGEKFVVTVNGTSYTYTTIAATETNATVIAGLRAAVAAGAPAGITVGAVVGSAFALTAAVPGTSFTVATSTTSATTTESFAVTTANVVANSVTAPVGGIAGGTVTIVDANSADTTGTKANTITTATLDGFGAGSAVKSNALTSLTLANSAKDVTVTDNTATPTNTTLGVTVNNLGAGAALTDGTIKTLNITTAAKDSALNVTAGAMTALTVAGTNALDLSGSTLGALKTVAVSGAAGVTGNFSGATVTSFDSSASTGNVTVTVDDTKATFKGGNGVNVVTISGDATKSIAAGSGTSDVLVLNNVGATFTAANTGVNATGFESIRTTTASNGTYDMSAFATANSIDVAAAPAGALTFANVAAGTSLAVDVAPGFVVNYTLKTDTSSDSLNLSVGNVNADGIAFAGNAVAVGAIESLTINSLGSNKAGTNVNTLLVTDAAATSLKVTGSESLTLTGLAGATVKSIDATGMGKGLTLDVTGISLTTAGTTFTGGAGNYKFTDATIAAGKTDTVTAGDGSHVITIGNASNTANASVTLGNGNSTVDLSLTGGKDTIVVGNGNNTLKGGAGNDIITVGSGTNTIKGGAGADVITLAAHAGQVDTIQQASGDSGANNATVTQTSELANTFDVVKGIAVGDKIDLSLFAGAYATANLVLAGTNLAAQDDKVVFVSGTYDANAGTFTYSANGTDTAVTYDHTVGVNVNAETIILVGFHVGTTATATAGVITLA